MNQEQQEISSDESYCQNDQDDSSLQVYFPILRIDYFKHLQNITEDNIIIVQILQTVFSDSFLYINSQLLQKVLYHPKGYVSIQQILRIKAVNQLIGLSRLFHQLPQRNFIFFIRKSIQLNSNILKCNNNYIRRKIPFVNKLEMSKLVYFQYRRETANYSLSQELEQLLGYFQSQMNVYKLSFNRKTQWGFLYIQNPLFIISKLSEKTLEYYHHHQQQLITIMQKWRFLSYQNIMMTINSSNKPHNYKKLYLGFEQKYKQNLLKYRIQNNKQEQNFKRGNQGKGKQNSEDLSAQFKSIRNPNFNLNNHFFDTSFQSSYLKSTYKKKVQFS